MDELAFADATTLAGRIKAREISSAELLEHYISRMEKYNPEINAIICTQLDKARDRARQADESLAAGGDWGPLHGVPMTVKESFNLTGLPTTWGTHNSKTILLTMMPSPVQGFRPPGQLFLARPMCRLISRICKVSMTYMVRPITPTTLNEALGVLPEEPQLPWLPDCLVLKWEVISVAQFEIRLTTAVCLAIRPPGVYCQYGDMPNRVC